MDQTDLDQIAGLIDKRISGLEEKLFDWKSEIVDAVDVMAKEIRDEREFREIVGQQVGENRNRIVNLEKKVFGTSV